MMYATLVSFDPFWQMCSKTGLQPRSIPRRLRAEARRAKAATGGLVVAAAVLTCTDLRSQIQFKSDEQLRLREAPAYLDLFAPAGHRDAYRAYVSPVDLETMLRQLLADSAVLHPTGAWTPQPLIPYDAFGLSGSYNRWKVAGLYRSRRAQVARGPRVEQGQTEFWTLIAPFPDPALQRLELGTLVIVLRVPSD